MTADFASSPLIVAGFADGTVKVFDRRLRDTDSVVKIHREHASWVVRAKCQKYDEKALVTARFYKLPSFSCAISPWRFVNIVVRTAKYTCGIRVMRHAQLVAGGYTNGLLHSIYMSVRVCLPGMWFWLKKCGSVANIISSTSALTQSNWRSHTTVVHSLPICGNKDDVLSRVVHPTGLHEMPNTHTLPFYSDVVFHPNEMLYAIAGADGTVRLMGCKLQERREQSYAGILRPYDVSPSTRSSLDTNGFQHPDQMS